MEKTIEIPLPQLTQLITSSAKKLLDGPSILPKLVDATSGITVEGLIIVTKVNESASLEIQGTITHGNISYTGRSGKGAFFASLITTKEWQWCEGKLWIRGTFYAEVLNNVLGKYFVLESFGASLSYIFRQPHRISTHDRLKLFFENSALLSLENGFSVLYCTGHYMDTDGHLWTIGCQGKSILGQCSSLHKKVVYNGDKFWEVYDNLKLFDEMHTSSRLLDPISEGEEDEPESKLLDPVSEGEEEEPGSKGEGEVKDEVEEIDGEQPGPKRLKKRLSRLTVPILRKREIAKILETLNWPEDQPLPPKHIMFEDMIDILRGIGIDVNGRFVGSSLVYILQLLRRKCLSLTTEILKPGQINPKLRKIIASIDEL